jgi:hypothetical protein
LADISIGEQAQVRFNLVVEFSIRSVISEQSPDSRRQRAKIMDHLYPLPFSLKRTLSVIESSFASFVSKSP